MTILQQQARARIAPPANNEDVYVLALIRPRHLASFRSMDLLVLADRIQIRRKERDGDLVSCPGL
jgi:hypothetical protein